MQRYGWCLDGHHEQCRTEYMDWLNTYSRCGCDCHPAVDEQHIADFVENNQREIEPQLLGAGTRKPRRTKSVVAAKQVAKPARKNTAAEGKAIAATEAALAAIESDESVRERMTELLEEA